MKEEELVSRGDRGGGAGEGGGVEEQEESQSHS